MRWIRLFPSFEMWELKHEPLIVFKEMSRLLTLGYSRPFMIWPCLSLHPHALLTLLSPAFLPSSFKAQLRHHLHQEVFLDPDPPLSLTRPRQGHVLCLCVPVIPLSWFLPHRTAAVHSLLPMRECECYGGRWVHLGFFSLTQDPAQ